MDVQKKGARCYGVYSSQKPDRMKDGKQFCGGHRLPGFRFFVKVDGVVAFYLEQDMMKICQETTTDSGIIESNSEIDLYLQKNNI